MYINCRTKCAFATSSVGLEISALRTEVGTGSSRITGTASTQLALRTLHGQLAWTIRGSFTPTHGDNDITTDCEQQLSWAVHSGNQANVMRMDRVSEAGILHAVAIMTALVKIDEFEWICLSQTVN
jgi:hypothetical protein